MFDDLKPMAPEVAATIHERDEKLSKALEELLAVAMRSPVLYWLGSTVTLSADGITVSVSRADTRASRRQG